MNSAVNKVIDNEIIGYIIDGYSRSEIVAKIKRDYPKRNEGGISKDYETARAAISQKVALDAEDVIRLHVKWYEDLWRKFDILEYVPGKNAASRQKEKVLGLLKEDNVLKIENDIKVRVGKGVEYDTSKLTLEEKKRLERYLKIVVVK